MSGNISRDAAVRAIMAQKWESGSDGAAALAIVAGAPAVEMPTLAERDAALEKLWAELEDVPMNPETECLETPFLNFPVGTFREDIWHWFDERHSKGVAYLLYHAENRPNKCYTVIDTSYDVGINIYSFWRRENAERSIKDDVQTELTNLRKAGRERIEVQDTLDGATVYVPDTDIYYEWAIVENDIR